MTKFNNISVKDLENVDFNNETYYVFKYAYLLCMDNYNNYNNYNDKEKEIIETVIKKEYYMYLEKEQKRNR